MTWIKITRGHNLPADMLLPHHLFAALDTGRSPTPTPDPDQSPGTSPAPDSASTWILRFGTGTVSVAVGTWEPPTSGLGTGMSDPVPVQMGAAILAQLHIPPEPVYRLRVTPGALEIGPVLGLLVDDNFLSAQPQPAPGKFATAYARTGGLYVAFSPRTAFVRNGHGFGAYFDPASRSWQSGFVPLPQVAYRRSYGGNAAAVRRLRTQVGVQVFNSRRLDKWETHRLLSPDPGLRSYLPETVRLADGSEVLAMLERHRRVVLKPAALSRGRGIVFIEHTGRDGFLVLDYRRRLSRFRLPAAGLLGWVRAELRGRPYLCQQWVNLARVRGAPFDIRVVMQRNASGDWRCSGLACRVAARGKWLTNLARGASVMRLPRALRRAFGGAVDPESVRARLVELGHSICHRLDSSGETLGELGLDLALDAYGRMWYLETNMRPAFQGFAQIDPDRYRRILVAPFLYASYLAGFDRYQDARDRRDPRRAGIGCEDGDPAG